MHAFSHTPPLYTSRLHTCIRSYVDLHILHHHTVTPSHAFTPLHLSHHPQYGVPLGALGDDPLLMERRLDLAHSAALVLDKHNLIRCAELC